MEGPIFLVLVLDLVLTLDNYVVTISVLPVF